MILDDICLIKGMVLLTISLHCCCCLFQTTSLGRQAVVAPNVFDIVEVAHLRKGAQEGFSVFVVAKADGFGPVVAPLNHGARFEVVGSKLVEVSTTARHFLPHAHLGPIAESRSNILRMYH